ncbi:Ltp family lipoprotein [Alteribacter aurantiacus]|uniref:Ltp family lipoprotein n=1 Tax=Alteribacter aurantiacus TaxID=254410 RepID=UPI00041C43C7|nr:Ltp family lipoprotein [Alteribacter aurantiacus]
MGKLKEMSKKAWAPFVMVLLIAPLFAFNVTPFAGVVIAGFGLYLLWKHEHFAKAGRIATTGALSFIALIGFIVAAAASGGDEVAEEEPEAEEASAAEAEEEEATEEEEVTEEEVPEAETYEYTIEENFRMEDDLVILEADTNLDDGVIVSWEVENLDDFDHFDDGQVTVEDGAFSVEVDVSDFGSGEILAWIGISGAQQDEDLVDEFLGDWQGANVGGDLEYDEYGMLYSFEETFLREGEPEEELTLSQVNAIGSAESYLDFSAFSKEGLIDQLEFEGFSNEDATFAVEYIDVDWYEQAVKSGEAYLDYSNFSRSGLIDQLEFEGFTNSQATHAVDEIGL